MICIYLLRILKSSVSPVIKGSLCRGDGICSDWYFFCHSGEGRPACSGTVFGHHFYSQTVNKSKGRLYPKKIIFGLAWLLILGLLAPAPWGASEAAVRKERIMVVIPEVHLRRPKVPDPAGETEIVRVLIEAGYKLVDQEQVKKIRYNDIFEKAWKGDDTGALMMARKFQAEILIVGEAFSEFAQEIRVPDQRGMPGGNLISCRARVEAKAVRTDTGQIVATYGAHASGVDISENIAAKKALAEAGRKAAEYFVDMFARKSPSASGAGIEMIVQGIRGFSQLNGLKTQLSRVPGVQDVEVLNFEGGSATIDVTFKGNAMELAAAMEGNGVKLKINKLEATRIKAAF